MHRSLPRPLIPLALLPVVMLAACNRMSAPPPAAPAATVASPGTVDTVDTAAVDTAAVATVAASMGVSEAPAPGEHTTFDAKAFAGGFADAGTQVEFAADGTYTMSVHAQSANADLASDGTWTLEPDGRHIRLDPGSKAEQDRVYEIVSMDELHASNGQVLRRGAARAQR